MNSVFSRDRARPYIGTIDDRLRQRKNCSGSVSESNHSQFGTLAENLKVELVRKLTKNRMLERPIFSFHFHHHAGDVIVLRCLAHKTIDVRHDAAQ